MRTKFMRGTGLVSCEIVKAVARLLCIFFVQEIHCDGRRVGLRRRHTVVHQGLSALPIEATHRGVIVERILLQVANLVDIARSLVSTRPIADQSRRSLAIFAPISEINTVVRMSAK